VSAVTVRPFGVLDGREIAEVVLASERAEASVLELGATVRDLKIRRRDGRWQRVVLGLNALDDYIRHSPNFGNIVGRYAGRIGKGRFVLDGVAHQLPLEPGRSFCLHGGNRTGFGKRPWRMLHHDVASVTLGLVSPDGDNGFPGTLTVTCRYALIGATLRIEISATTDRATVVNFAHHSYFNLDGSVDVRDHNLEVRANLHAPTDADLVPSGALAPISGTPLDFRTPKPVRSAGPIDHTYLLRRDRSEPAGPDGLVLAHAATLAAPDASLSMAVWTTEPALQVYDGAKVSVPVPGLSGAAHGAHAGLCLEAQHVPDSPNLPHFPSTTLRPGQVYRQRTEYRFD
jgi:aldose 1-epimerase